MKATDEQQELIFAVFNTYLRNYNKQNETFHRKGDLNLGECWVMFQAFLLQSSNDDTNPNIRQRWFIQLDHSNRPAEAGTVREWLFKGLNDTHLQSVFKAWMRSK